MAAGLRQSLQQAIQEVLSLFLSGPCVLCQRSSAQALCERCAAQVQACALPRHRCHQEWKEALPLFAWGRYEDPLKRSIAALKYDKQTQLAALLGRWMAEAWHQTHPQRSSSIPGLTVVPIPLHAHKIKQRGFNQAALLAQVFCRYTGLPWMETGLLRIKATEAQFGLSKQARLENVAAAFAVHPRLQQRQGKVTILLLDDIFTTGATARSAQQVLQQAQIPVYGMVTLARAGQGSGSDSPDSPDPQSPHITVR